MPMHRERQFNMFDVATGACTLEQYLQQRYNESDLNSKFWIDEKDTVDELRQPEEPDPSGQSKPVAIRLQGPPPEESQPQESASGPTAAQPERPTSAPRAVRAEASQPARDGQDSFQSSAPPRSQPAGSSPDSFQKTVNVPPGGISLADLARGGPSQDS